jgi:hypothetical protein
VRQDRRLIFDLQTLTIFRDLRQADETLEGSCHYYPPKRRADPQWQTRVVQLIRELESSRKQIGEILSDPHAALRLGGGIVLVLRSASARPQPSDRVNPSREGFGTPPFPAYSFPVIQGISFVLSLSSIQQITRN